MTDEDQGDRADICDDLRQRAEKAEAEVKRLRRILSVIEGQARASANAARGIVDRCDTLLRDERDTSAARDRR